MAFHATEPKTRGDAQSLAQRWLREIFFEDWGLKLLALFITLGLWYGVTSQRVPASRRLRSVQLSFLRPDDVEISNDPLNSVEVTLQGRKNDIDDLIASNLVATVDISGFKLGERVVRLTRETVTLNLPEGVRVDNIEPSSVALRLERRIEREVEVEARTEGRPPSGYEVRGVQITPGRVRVRGPESIIRNLEKAFTETISLEGQKETLNLPQTAIDIPNAKIVTLDPVVSVRVEIGAERIEKTFARVSVRTADGDGQAQPTNANVVLRGERPVLENLRPEDFEIILERMADGTLQPRLPPSMQGRAELVSINPSEFSINK
ncbi:MAG TPA: CdaR family protein [Pyrinomonadaceae bacterium]|jgi:YbbR domain-containing protein